MVTDIIGLVAGIVRNPKWATIALGMVVVVLGMFFALPKEMQLPITRFIYSNADGPTAQELSQAKYHFQQGLTFATMGRIDEGIREFSEAIRLNPNYAAAYGNRGVAYMIQKKYNKALEDLDKAVRIDPKDRNAFYNLAALRTLRQEFDLALEALDRALARGFDNYDALRRDADLEGLRRQPEFRTLLERHKISL